MYGVEVSPALISEVTDAVLEEVKTWQNRPLEPIYGVVYLDALYVKMRHEGRVDRRDTHTWRRRQEQVPRRPRPRFEGLGAQSGGVEPDGGEGRMGEGLLCRPAPPARRCTALSRIRRPRKAKGGNCAASRRSTGGAQLSSSRSGHTFRGPGSFWSTASTVTSSWWRVRLTYPYPGGRSSMSTRPRVTCGRRCSPVVEQSTPPRFLRSVEARDRRWMLLALVRVWAYPLWLARHSWREFGRTTATARQCHRSRPRQRTGAPGCLVPV